MEVVHQKQQFFGVIEQFITNKEECKEMLVMCEECKQKVIYIWAIMKVYVIQTKLLSLCFTTEPGEYKSNLELKINNTALPMETHPKVLGLTLDPKLTYSTHLHNISV